MASTGLKSVLLIALIMTAVATASASADRLNKLGAGYAYPAVALQLLSRLPTANILRTISTCHIFRKVLLPQLCHPCVK